MSESYNHSHLGNAASAAALRQELEQVRRRAPRVSGLAHSIEGGRIVTRHRGVCID